MLMFEQPKSGTDVGLKHEHERTAVSLVHNPQLGGLFGGVGHGGGFFGPRRVPPCYPIFEGTQKTLTFFRLLLLVKCRSVNM